MRCSPKAGATWRLAAQKEQRAMASGDLRDYRFIALPTGEWIFKGAWPTAVAERHLHVCEKGVVEGTLNLGTVHLRADEDLLVLKI
jgi:hypothetical protein